MLQSSLKSGHKAGHKAGQDGQASGLRELLAMPALLDARTETRIEHLLTRYAKDGR